MLQEHVLRPKLVLVVADFKKIENEIRKKGIMEFE
jgi:hypothetical protein